MDLFNIISLITMKLVIIFLLKGGFIGECEGKTFMGETYYD